MLRRETNIALRARHTAFRIAIEILHPRMTVPPPQQTHAAPGAGQWGELVGPIVRPRWPWSHRLIGTAAVVLLVAYLAFLSLVVLDG